MEFDLIARITCIKERLTGRSHWSCAPIRHATSRKGSCNWNDKRSCGGCTAIGSVW